MYKLVLFCAALLLPPLLQAGSINDPMRPSQPGRSTVQTKPVQPAYRLDSIIIASDRRLAVINGRLLAEGERIGSTQVERIETTRVTLRTGKRSEVLTLLPVSIKSPSSEAKP